MRLKRGRLEAYWPCPLASRKVDGSRQLSWTAPSRRKASGTRRQLSPDYAERHTWFYVRRRGLPATFPVPEARASTCSPSSAPYIALSSGRLIANVERLRRR